MVRHYVKNVGYVEEARRLDENPGDCAECGEPILSDKPRVRSHPLDCEWHVMCAPMMDPAETGRRPRLMVRAPSTSSP